MTDTAGALPSVLPTSLPASGKTWDSVGQRVTACPSRQVLRSEAPTATPAPASPDRQPWTPPLGTVEAAHAEAPPGRTLGPVAGEASRGQVTSPGAVSANGVTARERAPSSDVVTVTGEGQRCQRLPEASASEHVADPAQVPSSPDRPCVLHSCHRSGAATSPRDRRQQNDPHRPCQLLGRGPRVARLWEGRKRSTSSPGCSPPTPQGEFGVPGSRLPSRSPKCGV